jgi:hypothetical protein
VVQNPKGRSKFRAFALNRYFSHDPFRPLEVLHFYALSPGNSDYLALDYLTMDKERFRPKKEEHQECRNP